MWPALRQYSVIVNQMRQHKFLILVSGAIVGFGISHFATPLHPWTIDQVGPADFFRYQHDIAFFIRGIYVAIFALIAARFIKTGIASVLMASLLALILYFVYSVLIGYFSTELWAFTLFFRALPGYFAGNFFVIGIWLSFAQYSKHE
jgi:hypothetical protein